jgi:hypothetical protein
MRAALFSLMLALPSAALAQPAAPAPVAATPATQGLAKLKALEGEWVDVDGVFGTKGKVAVTYKVSGGGHTVVETFPVGTPYEMVTVYHLDGDSLVLTHYCNQNTQPRMRSGGLEGAVLSFEFAGGTNIDPATTGHMHAVRMEFVSNDELTSAWLNWKGGQATGPAHPFRIVRKR